MSPEVLIRLPDIKGKRRLVNLRHLVSAVETEVGLTLTMAVGDPIKITGSEVDRLMEVLIFRAVKGRQEELCLVRLKK